MIRKGPPLPPSIFMGSAVTKPPAAGSCSSEATFSKIGMLAVQRTTCVSKWVDGPSSMLAVSMPTALIDRSWASQAAASGESLGSHAAYPISHATKCPAAPYWCEQSGLNGTGPRAAKRLERDGSAGREAV